MPLSNKDYKARAKQLKKAGFVDYDLRRAEFTKAEKARIRKLYASNSEIVNNPDKFQKIRAGKKTRAAAKKSGLAVSKSAVYVEKGNYSSVKIVHRKGVAIVRKANSERVITEKLIHGEALLNELEKVGKKKLPANCYMTVRIGKNNPFKSVFRSADQLLYYLTNVFQPADDGADIDDLIAGMSLVKFCGDYPDEWRRPAKKSRRRGQSYNQKRTGK